MSRTQHWLRRTSLGFLGLIPLIALLTVALPIIYWGFGGYNFWDNTIVLADTPPREGGRWLGFLVGAPATAAWLYALYRLQLLFLQFRRGIFINIEAARHLRAFSLFTVVAVIFDILTSGARRWAMGEHNSPFWTHININGEHASLVLSASVFLIVSFVLIEAERYKNETEQYL